MLSNVGKDDLYSNKHICTWSIIDESSRGHTVSAKKDTGRVEGEYENSIADMYAT